MPKKILLSWREPRGGLLNTKSLSFCKCLPCRHLYQVKTLIKYGISIRHLQQIIESSFLPALAHHLDMNAINFINYHPLLLQDITKLMLFTKKYLWWPLQKTCGIPHKINSLSLLLTFDMSISIECAIWLPYREKTLKS